MYVVFQVSHSMKQPKPTCQRSRMSWGWNRPSSSSFFKKRKVRRLPNSVWVLCYWKHQSKCLLWKKKKWNAFVYALVSLVLRGENAGWRKRLVSRELCHRNHQPHCHGAQRATNEASAQRNQRVSHTHGCTIGQQKQKQTADKFVPSLFCQKTRKVSHSSAWLRHPEAGLVRFQEVKHHLVWMFLLFD